ncbi:drug/metabolite transporter (DMT)-like permease [Microvirga flocculans]|uniref:Drug/metabolite transporter (DMT)-like permease n=1 Tax=Microvirga flocculans TaxID=217168 RepID=A0A7W6N8R5_9HYPH|nr:DMT family transporter [Microvirga flocculans]MBB4040936.1 drug/metabolite transporter (DMT)-like permease [Microvirga flocculans]
MDRTTEGWICGFLGVVIFSGSLPATRIAVLDIEPLFLTLARASIAGLLAMALLMLLRQKYPGRGDLLPLAIVSLGVVVGFPLLTALALQHITAAHSISFVGLLPLTTAIFGIVRGGERPRPAFWLFSGLGAVCVAGFALLQGPSTSPLGNLLMLGAILLCGLGYAEGAKLSLTLGGWQVISWALVLSLPLMAGLMLLNLPPSWTGIGMPAWLGLAYVSLFSMLIGFVFWYRGLALGGIAGVAQLQLLQPFFGLLLAALLLHESVGWEMIAVNVAVIACVAGARHFAKPGVSRKVAGQSEEIVISQ